MIKCINYFLFNMYLFGIGLRRAAFAVVVFFLLDYLLRIILTF